MPRRKSLEDQLLFPVKARFDCATNELLEKLSDITSIPPAVLVRNFTVEGLRHEKERIESVIKASAAN